MRDPAQVLVRCCCIVRVGSVGVTSVARHGRRRAWTNTGREAELYAFSLTLLSAQARLISEGKLLTSMGMIGQLAFAPLIPRRLRKPRVELTELTSFRLDQPSS
jgi:hypothetical protein